MSINILERLRLGRKAEQDRRAETEAGKLGILRAGMSGIMSENGDIAGTCHRKTHLRSLGVELEKPDEHKMIMFELGFASEDITATLLRDSLQPGEILLREEEIPIEWRTSGGILVTGRPDIVVCAAAGAIIDNTFDNIPGDQKILDTPNGPVFYKPLLGLELKSVHSVWTARDVLFGGKPKMNNLAQAAHYMWKLGVPYKLIYKSYSQLGQAMNDWAMRAMNLPRPGEPNSQYVEFNDKGGVKGLRQFEIVYDLSIDKSGFVRYKLEQEPDAAWKRSIVNVNDIERYYEYVATMESKKDLGPRPMTIDSHGKKANYTDCGYCPLQSVCDQYEKAGYEAWLREVKNVTGT